MEFNLMKKWYLMFAMPLLAFGVSGVALAETQNVKVSGSLDAYAFYRSNFDFRDGNDAGSVPAGAPVPGVPRTATTAQSSESDEFFMSITQLQVSADLTDNVSTVVNLINQRDWNATPLDSTTAAPGTVVGAVSTANEFDILLDLAYVQMKEIFYAPLTMTIGRQDLLFGRGFIVGWNPQDSQNLLQADEFTQVQSFDAVRATLDFNPWTVDLVYSKIREGADNPEDDRDLYISYLTYKFAEYNAVAEGYYIGEFDRNTLAAAGGTVDNNTDTWGARVQFDPISQITLGAELAYQAGEYASSTITPKRDRDAWAVDLFGEYRFADNAWKPMLGLEYVSLSGEADLSASAGSYGAWNGAYRGPVYGWIHDYKEVYYSTAAANDQFAGQNQQDISIYGSIMPMSDLKLAANYFHFWAAEDYHTTTTSPSSSVLGSTIGDELDLTATYSYTADVTFNFMADWFFPGDLYSSPNDEIATQFVSEVKVVF